MAIIKSKDARKLSKKDIQEKINELKFELVKSNVTANKSKAKTKEIKRTISRLITINNSHKEELKSK